MSEPSQDNREGARPSRFALWPLPELEFPAGFDGGPGFGPVSAGNEQQNAYERGYEDGNAAGRAAAAQELTAVVARLREAVEQLAQEKQEIMAGLERNVQIIALAVARQLFQREVEIDPTITTQLVRQALELVPMTDKVTVRMNPADIAYVSEHVHDDVEDDKHARIEWVADSTLDRGSCVVDSPERCVDGTIDVLIRDLAHRMKLQDAE